VHNREATCHYCLLLYLEAYLISRNNDDTIGTAGKMERIQFTRRIACEMGKKVNADAMKH